MSSIERGAPDLTVRRAIELERDGEPLFEVTHAPPGMDVNHVTLSRENAELVSLRLVQLLREYTLAEERTRAKDKRFGRPRSPVDAVAPEAVMILKDLIKGRQPECYSGFLCEHGKDGEAIFGDEVRPHHPMCDRINAVFEKMIELEVPPPTEGFVGKTATEAVEDGKEELYCALCGVKGEIQGNGHPCKVSTRDAIEMEKRTKSVSAAELIKANKDEDDRLLWLPCGHEQRWDLTTILRLFGWRNHTTACQRCHAIYTWADMSVGPQEQGDD